MFLRRWKYTKKIIYTSAASGLVTLMIYTHRESISERLLRLFEKKLFLVTEGIVLSCETLTFSSASSLILSNGNLALRKYTVEDDPRLAAMSTKELAIKNNFSCFDLDFDRITLTWSWKRLVRSAFISAISSLVNGISSKVLDSDYSADSIADPWNNQFDIGIESVDIERVRGTIDRRHVFWDIEGDGDGDGDGDEERQNQEAALSSKTISGDTGGKDKAMIMISDSSSDESPFGSDSPLDKYYTKLRAKNLKFCQKLPVLSDLTIRDAMVTVMHPEGFRPFQISILSAEVPILRPTWVMHDLLTATSIVGLYDNCLFSLHANQNSKSTSSSSLLPEHEIDDAYVQERILKIDNVPLYHMISSEAAGGVLKWIKQGSVDVSLMIKFNAAVSGSDAFKRIKLSDTIASKIDEVMVNLKKKRQIPCQPEPEASPQSDLNNHEHNYLSHENDDDDHNDNVTVEMLRQDRLTDDYDSNGLHFQLDLNFSNLRASLPPILAEPRQLHPVSNALARPLVAYINTHNVKIPITCSFSIPMANFLGSMSIYESRLADAFNQGVTERFSRLARNEREATSPVNLVSRWWRKEPPSSSTPSSSSSTSSTPSSTSTSRENNDPSIPLGPTPFQSFNLFPNNYASDMYFISRNREINKQRY